MEGKKGTEGGEEGKWRERKRGTERAEKLNESEEEGNKGRERSWE